MTNTKTLIFAENLKKYRKLKKITQDELANLLDTTKTTIYNYEKGTSFPDIRILYKLCEIFSVTPNELLGDKGVSIFGSENLTSLGYQETKKDIAKVLLQCLNIEKYFSFSFKEIPDSIYPSKMNHTFSLEINDKDIVNLIAYYIEQRKNDPDFLNKTKKRLDELNHLVESKLYSGFDEEF